ncbi:MAG: hypothetical protein WAK31_09490 [Chthoniobacterales bacterium]
MKTSTTSNWRPLSRAFFQCLIAVAVLWAAPRNAEAQLYILQSPPFSGALGSVSEYTSTGKVINANFITGLQNPTCFVVSDNILFVAYLAGPSDIGTVGKYDATTGGAINAGFITGLVNPIGLAVNGNNLLVTYAVDPGTVGEYNATTGAVISANFITGLTTPTGLALLRTRLFVTTEKLISGRLVDTVGKYDASTGAAINSTFIRRGNVIAASGNTLFGRDRAHAVGEYDATTGAVINANFITGLKKDAGALALAGNGVFVANFLSGTVGEYDASTGAVINANFITGAELPPGNRRQEHKIALTA